jgi:SAM-dependent methyltransferase
MAQHDWNEHYASGFMPWDLGEPNPQLVELVVEAGMLSPGRVLEVGCGTGTDAIWLASRGFDIDAVDISPLAIDKACAKQGASKVRFAVLDFLRDPPPAGPFDLVFDRGVLHVFDEAEERSRFAQLVAQLLAPNGQWVSLLGSTEGPPRDAGPPRRSARDIMEAVEPSLEIVSLRSTTFDADLPTVAKAWVLIARAREVPAQPSTRRA